MVKKLWQHVKPFSSNTRTSLTDRRTDRFAISISRVSVLTRYKNRPKYENRYRYAFAETITSLPNRSPIFQQSIYKNLAIANRSRVSCAHNVEGIYDNPVTLKSRLTVTHGHWKRNHWIDHIRLTIRRVIGRWILLWPWNVGQKLLNVIETGAIRKLRCGLLFALYSNCRSICSRLWDIQCQRMAWPWKPG